MVIRFESKRDLTFPLVWGFVFIIYSIIGITILYHGGSISDLYVLIAVFLGLGVLFFAIIITTYYTIGSEMLTCHMLGFKKRIKIQEIRKIESQKGMYAGLKMNTAWKGIVIGYGKWDEILISPAEPEKFAEALVSQNPAIQINL